MTLIASLACRRGRIARITCLRQEDFDYDQQRAHAERRGGDALVEMDQYDSVVDDLTARSPSDREAVQNGHDGISFGDARRLVLATSM